MTDLVKPGPELRQLFHSFEHTAFRLETYDRYDAPYENERLQSWLTMNRDARLAGRDRFSRVRVVTTPLTDYN